MDNQKTFDSKAHIYGSEDFNFKGNPFVRNLIKNKTTVLDVGCGTGKLAIGLKEKGCTVYGMDISPLAINQAKKHLDFAAVVDLENFHRLPFKNVQFDFIVFADILEHLRNPEELLEKLKPYLKKNGSMVISLPNIAFLKVRLDLIRGNFDYTDSGIMDNTHVHFYTKRSLLQFLEIAGCRVIHFEGFPFTINKFKNLGYLISQKKPELFARQFIVEVKCPNRK